MKIIIEQTIHGYLNGHQLLASSIELMIEERQLMLIQSDLSGSNIEKGFESYVTGYPLSNRKYYSFAKTWYANEMKRPGCVWTHSLLIKMPDIGKFASLQCLDSFFKRPDGIDFSQYKKSFEVEISQLDNENEDNGLVDISILEQFQTCLYEYPRSSVICPAINSQQFENVIYRLWSDQWPRLRRNFTFCSGALSSKLINTKEFDLQIVPIKRADAVKRETKTGILTTEVLGRFNWRDYNNIPVNIIRGYLWVLGADTPGFRSSLIPLLKIFFKLSSNSCTVAGLFDLVASLYPNSKDAKSLKVKLFGENSLLLSRFTEKEILQFILLRADISPLPVAELNLDARLLKLMEKQELGSSEIINLWLNGSGDILPVVPIDYIKANWEEVLFWLSGDFGYSEIILSRIPLFFTEPRIWKGDINHQQKLLNLYLRDNPVSISMTQVAHAMLNAESDIIFFLYRNKGKDVVTISLHWLNRRDNKQFLISSWSKFIATEEDELFLSWICNQRGDISSKVYAILFIYVHFNRWGNAGLSTVDLLDGYNQLKVDNYAVKLSYVASALLSLGLDSKLPDSSGLVVGVFHDVYSFAVQEKIELAAWNIIPKDFGQEDEEIKPLIMQFIDFLGGSPPKKIFQVESWDFCEQLVRTLSNRIIKNRWGGQVFLDSLHNNQAFSRAVNYILSYKKGRKFLYQLYVDIRSGKIVPDEFQYQLIKRIEPMFSKKGNR